MIKKLFLTVSCGLSLAGMALAQGTPADESCLAGSAVYSDPGFQDFVETSDGYLNPKHRPAAAGDFRDAVASTSTISSAAVPAKKEKLVFVSILPKSKNYSALLAELQASAGFVFSGERTDRSKKTVKTRMVGRAPAGSLGLIRKNPGVAAVRVEKEGTDRSGPDALR